MMDDGSCQYENTTGNAEVFTTFSWLSNYVNQSNCEGASITVYSSGAYNFVLIQNGNENKLYFENGAFYCSDTPTYSCITAYNLSNVTQTWSCGNSTPVSGCTDANAINYNASATVDDDNCTGESITVYSSGIYNYVLVKNGSEGKLYFENGTFYCNDTPTYSCVTAYNLSNVTQTWTCGNTTPVSGCTDTNAINYNVNATVDDGSCQYETTNSPVFTTYPWLSNYVDQNNCAGASITVYSSGIYNYVLIKNGSESKLYFENGTFYCNQTSTFSCVNAYGLSNVSQSWSCGGSTSVSGCTDMNAVNYNAAATVDDGSCQYENTNTEVFATYPWLNTLVDPNNCSGESITVYDTGNYNFIYIQTPTSNRLYFENGAFYCEDAPGYSCISLYNLSNVVSVWNCGGANSLKKQNTITSNLKLKEEFKIYPNPTSGKVFIDLPDESFTQINLMDISGKVINQIENNEYQTTIEMNVSDVPKGIYLVQLKNKQTQQLQKLIIE